MTIEHDLEASSNYFEFEFWYLDVDVSDTDYAVKGINLVTKDVTVEEEADLFWVFITGGCVALIILIIIVLVYCRYTGEKKIQTEVIQ